MSEREAFSPGEVLALVPGLTYAELAYLNRNGVLQPSVRLPQGRGVAGIYGERDILAVTAYRELDLTVGVLPNNGKSLIAFIQGSSTLQTDRYPYLVCTALSSGWTPMTAAEVSGLFTRSDPVPVRVVLNLKSLIEKVRGRIAAARQRQAEKDGREYYATELSH